MKGRDSRFKNVRFYINCSYLYDKCRKDLQTYSEMIFDEIGQWKRIANSKQLVIILVDINTKQGETIAGSARKDLNRHTGHLGNVFVE